MFQLLKNIVLLLLLAVGKTVAQSPCDSNKVPIVFVHGFLASGDTWATQVQHFTSNGYCDERMFLFDWNTIGGRQKNDSLLDDFINKVLQKTGSKKVNLVGHSAGGGLCYAYLKDSARSLKVQHYAHIGSRKIDGPAGYNGNVSTINIYSTDDMVLKGNDAAGVKNIRQTGNDHLQVASSSETFSELYTFFNDTRPETHSVIPSTENKISISGRAVMLGENTPLIHDSIFVFTYDPVKGKRVNKKNNIVLVTDENGYWPSFPAGKEDYLEFELHPHEGRVVNYFIEPQPRDNRNIYLRSIPASGMAGAMLKALPAKDDQAAVAIFSANHAIIYGRDSLTVDGKSLSSTTANAAAKTVIASFLFDDGDGKSSGLPLKGFGPGIFLNAIDLFIPADKEKSFNIYFNGRTMALPCKAGKEAVLVAIFN